MLWKLLLGQALHHQSPPHLARGRELKDIPVEYLPEKGWPGGRDVVGCLKRIPLCKWGRIRSCNLPFSWSFFIAGACLAFSFMEDKAGKRFVCPDATSRVTVAGTRSVSRAQCQARSHLMSLFLIRECCNQQVDAKLGRVEKPLGQEISK